MGDQTSGMVLDWRMWASFLLWDGSRPPSCWNWTNSLSLSVLFLLFLFLFFHSASQCIAPPFRAFVFHQWNELFRWWASDTQLFPAASPSIEYLWFRSKHATAYGPLAVLTLCQYQIDSIWYSNFLYCVVSKSKKEKKNPSDYWFQSNRI